MGSEKAGPKVAAILSVIESCRRLSVSPRDYLADVLRGLERQILQTGRTTDSRRPFVFDASSNGPRQPVSRPVKSLQPVYQGRTDPSAEERRRLSFRPQVQRASLSNTFQDFGGGWSPLALVVDAAAGPQPR